MTQVTNSAFFVTREDFTSTTSEIFANLPSEGEFNIIDEVIRQNGYLSMADLSQAVRQCPKLQNLRIMNFIFDQKSRYCNIDRMLKDCEPLRWLPYEKICAKMEAGELVRFLEEFSYIRRKEWVDAWLDTKPLAPYIYSLMNFCPWAQTDRNVSAFLKASPDADDFTTMIRDIKIAQVPHVFRAFLALNPSPRKLCYLAEVCPAFRTFIGEEAYKENLRFSL
jgi:hypothetical protein